VQGVPAPDILEDRSAGGGPAAAEEYGEKFSSQGGAEMELSGQDLFGEGEPGRADPLSKSWSSYGRRIGQRRSWRWGVSFRRERY
jgi:hypothetical protein